MTPSDTTVVNVSDAARAALAGLLSAYAARRAGWDGEAPVRIVGAEVLVPGRPGVVDVLAELGDRMVHVPFGLRAPGDETHFVPDGEDAVIGPFEDEGGPAVAFDAMRDAEVAADVLGLVLDDQGALRPVRFLREDQGSVTVVAAERVAFTVYNHVVDGPRPDLDILLALDEVGFNHLAAPLAVWRGGGRDLGVVQEYLPGASSGNALALTSVRDLYASGGPPELAGGDFGAEAHRLGTMAARMHVGLDKAFGRRPGDVSSWARDIDDALGAQGPDVVGRPDVEQLLAQLGALQVASPMIRTHGDFHLGRTCRTEQGWYVVDFSPGGRPLSAVAASEDPGGGGIVFRSPLGDVADMLWSFGHEATKAADERDPSGREGLAELAHAWEARNRRAFLAGYLGVPGISGLVPPGREALRVLTACFEMVRSAVHESRS